MSYIMPHIMSYILFYILSYIMSYIISYIMSYILSHIMSYIISYIMFYIISYIVLHSALHSVRLIPTSSLLSYRPLWLRGNERSFIKLTYLGLIRGRRFSNPSNVGEP